MIDWQAIEGLPEERVFDFTRQESREQTHAALQVPHSAERLAATNECIRVYCKYRKEVQGRGFYVGSTAPGHRKIRDSFAAGALLMWESGTSPIEVLRYLARPGATRFAGGAGDLSVIPYTMMCAPALINQASCQRLAPASVKHAYAPAVIGKTAGLRERLVEKFGAERISAISESDEDLEIKVAERARQLRQNPTMFVPKAYRDVVAWLAECQTA